jgi:hypothetical protein
MQVLHKFTSLQGCKYQNKSKSKSKIIHYKVTNLHIIKLQFTFFLKIKILEIYNVTILQIVKLKFANAHLQTSKFSNVKMYIQIIL